MRRLQVAALGDTTFCARHEQSNLHGARWHEIRPYRQDAPCGEYPLHVGATLAVARTALRAVLRHLQGERVLDTTFCIAFGELRRRLGIARTSSALRSAGTNLRHSPKQAWALHSLERLFDVRVRCSPGMAPGKPGSTLAGMDTQCSGYIRYASPCRHQ